MYEKQLRNVITKIGVFNQLSNNVQICFENDCGSVLFCLVQANPLSVNPTKWPNTLKQSVGKLPTNCLSVFGYFVNLALKGLTKSHLIHFTNKIVLVLNNSIRSSLWVLELTVLKLTQCYRNIFLTPYLLTNPLLIHSSQNLLFLTTRWEMQTYYIVTFHLMFRSIKSFDLNQKARVCLTRNFSK